MMSSLALKQSARDWTFAGAAHDNERSGLVSGSLRSASASLSVSGYVTPESDAEDDDDEDNNDFLVKKQSFTAVSKCSVEQIAGAPIDSYNFCNTQNTALAGALPTTTQTSTVGEAGAYTKTIGEQITAKSHAQTKTTSVTSAPGFEKRGVHAPLNDLSKAMEQLSVRSYDGVSAGNYPTKVKQMTAAPMCAPMNATTPMQAMAALKAANGYAMPKAAGTCWMPKQMAAMSKTALSTVVSPVFGATTAPSVPMSMTSATSMPVPAYCDEMNAAMCMSAPNSECGSVGYLFDMPTPSTPQFGAMYPHAAVGGVHPFKHFAPGVAMPGAMAMAPPPTAGVNSQVQFLSILQNIIQLMASQRPAQSVCELPAGGGAEAGDWHAPNLLSLCREPQRLVWMCQDKEQSRYVQRLLEDASTPAAHYGAVAHILFQTRRRTLQLCQSTFGNYIVQKLLEKCCEDHSGDKEMLQLGFSVVGAVFKGNTRALSSNHCSCRVVQRLLRFKNPGIFKVKLAVWGELSSDAQTLICFAENPFGNHVLQHCIEHLPECYLSPLCDAMRGRSVALSKHKYGCRVIQKMMDTLSFKGVQHIFDECLEAAAELMRHEFGNYVIQHVMETCSNQRVLATLASAICSHVHTAVFHKFASNVMEKALVKIPSKLQVRVFEATLNGRTRDGGVWLVARMAEHHFGNYVIQRMLECCDRPQFAHMSRVFVQRITDAVTRDALVKYPWGRFVAVKMEPFIADSKW